MEFSWREKKKNFILWFYISYTQVFYRVCDVLFWAPEGAKKKIGAIDL